MIDTTIALAMLALTIIGHGVTTVWWAASLTRRVDHIERWIVTNERTGERLASLETKVSTVGDGVSRVEQLLISKQN